MANTIEVKVPDIGNYSDVPVIEVLVKPGDTVAKDQGLVTLESDKATMEVPSSVAGVVKEIRVKVDGTGSEGDGVQGRGGGAGGGFLRNLGSSRCRPSFQVTAASRAFASPACGRGRRAQ